MNIAQTFPTTIIIRHKKENLKKCSLNSLSKKDFCFYSYPLNVMPDLSEYILLTLDAPPLTLTDSSKGLVLLDATWRYAEKMLHCVLSSFPNIERRSLPSHYRTAYPRCQTSCSEPKRGLASIEALFIAYSILGRDNSNLLDSYYWKKEFLEKN